MSQEMGQSKSAEQAEPSGQIGQEEGGRQFGMALLAGLIIALILAGGGYLLLRSSNSASSARAVPLPMGPSEQAYVPHISFTDIEMSRATNFLKQEVTYIVGVVSNDGTRNIVEMEVTLEFHDVSQKVILREKQRFYGSKDAALAAEGKREFQLTFEKIPGDWDQAPPTFLIDGLKLQ